MNRQQRRDAERRGEVDPVDAYRLQNLIPTTGTVRFICECGERFREGYLAIAHTFEGHEVVRERFSLGEWRFLDTLDGRSVAEVIWNRLREAGEEPERFLERIKGAVAAKDEEMAAIEEAERQLGVRE